MLKVGIINYFNQIDVYSSLTNNPFHYEFFISKYTLNLQLISITNALITLFLVISVFIFFKLSTTFKQHNSFITLNIFQYTDVVNSLKPLFIIFFSLFWFTKNTTLFLPTLLLVLLFQPVIISPLKYLYVFNTNSLLCISMCQKKLISTTLINDVIAIFSFLLRFVSQYIRVILISTVYILLFEFTNTSFLNGSLIGTNIFQTKINLVFVTLLRLLIEIVDCFFILSVQLSIFFTVLLWLLSFLFLIKFNNVFEY